MLKNVRQFLTPGWVLTAVVAIAFSYLAFTVLAPWQLGKNTATKHRNEQLQHSFEVDPVDVGTLMPKGRGFEEGDEWRRVTAQGSFVPDSRVLLRNRPVNGAPAIQVLDIFAANNGEKYLINRGFVRPAGSDTPAIAPAPTGDLTISGYTRRNELTPVTPPIRETPPQVYGINIREIEGLTGQQLNPDWIQLSEDSAAVIEAIPLPTLESGPYLSYGIQWIFFGAMAPLAVIWFVRAELVERRRDRAEQEAMEKNLSDAAAAEPLDSPASAKSGEDTSADASREPADSSSKNQQDAPDARGGHDADSAAEQLHRERLAKRYGSSGHRAAGFRDDRYGERF
nr:SURF1 family cytochrome oxidase biogenesis protein [Corynebacterium lactis]